MTTALSPGLSRTQLGTRIRTEVLEGKRAEPGAPIVAALRRQSGWVHFRRLIPLKGPLEHEFYAAMCRVEDWTTRALAKEIDGMLYVPRRASKHRTRGGVGEHG